MYVADTIKEMAIVKGVKAAADWAAANKINISVVRFALFGRY